MGPWSPAVHEYLRHLEAAGFGGAPRVLDTDGDFEVLTYIDGEVAADPHWHPGHEHQLPAYAKTTKSLRASAVLLRRLHDAAGEIRNYSLYDYVLVNREVPASVETLVAIVKATRSRRDRMEDEIRPILETFSKVKKEA